MRRSGDQWLCMDLKPFVGPGIFSDAGTADLLASFSNRQQSMIMVLGSLEESMVRNVCAELQERKAPLLWVDNSHMPSSVKISYRPDGSFEFKVEDSWIAVPPDATCYHRLGFSRFESLPDYTPKKALSLTPNAP